jgi:hypothetical protein
LVNLYILSRYTRRASYYVANCGRYLVRERDI